MLALDSLSVRYGATPVLFDVSVAVRAGELVCVLGPNGSGKSTLMRAIVGLLGQFGGEVVGGGIAFEGQSLLAVQPHQLCRRGIAYVAQGGPVFPSMSVEENLRLGGLRLDPPGRLESRIRQVVGTVPALEALRSRRAGTLSGGERQLVAIGRALILEPRLLIMDEPTAGLSPRYSQAIFNIARAVCDGGGGCLVVEQNARLALAHLDRGYVLRRGALVYTGSRSERGRLEGALSLE